MLFAFYSLFCKQLKTGMYSLCCLLAFLFCKQLKKGFITLCCLHSILFSVSRWKRGILPYAACVPSSINSSAFLLTLICVVTELKTHWLILCVKMTVSLTFLSSNTLLFLLFRTLLIYFVSIWLIIFKRNMQKSVLTSKEKDDFSVWELGKTHEQLGIGYAHFQIALFLLFVTFIIFHVKL